MDGGGNPYQMASTKIDILILLREEEAFTPEYLPVLDLCEMLPQVDDSEIRTALNELDENAGAPLNYYTESNNVNICLSNKRETNTFITHLKQQGYVEEPTSHGEEPAEGDAWYLE